MDTLEFDQGMLLIGMDQQRWYQFLEIDMSMQRMTTGVHHGNFRLDYTENNSKV
jgi:hypothetical protein